MPDGWEVWETASRRQRALMRAERRERERRTLDERAAFLEAMLEEGETMRASGALHRPVVTDRRILWAERLPVEPDGKRWFGRSLAFADVTSRSLGRQHDGRPVLRMDHAPVPWWGVEGRRWVRIALTDTQLTFNRDTHPVLVATLRGLDAAGVPSRPAFTLRPEGTRAERTSGSERLLVHRARTGIMRLRIPFEWRLRLHELTSTPLANFDSPRWWLSHAIPWVVLAIPAWLISPWLVVPAIVMAELVRHLVMRAWIVRRFGRGPRIKMD